MEDPFEHVAAVNALDVVIVCDLHHNCLYANPAVERVLGLSQGDIVGHNLMDMLDPDQEAALREAWAAALTSPYSGAIADLQLPQADGAPLRMQVSLRMAPAEGGRPAVFVIVARPAEPGSIHRIPRWRHGPHIDATATVH